MSDQYDIGVIGAGPGGYVAAIKAAQNGKRVALIEKNQLGGVCLNRGCIPTKALLSNAKVLNQIKRAEEFGIETGSIKVHFDKMTERKERIVQSIRSNLEGLIKANKITIIEGEAVFESPTKLKILGDHPRFIDVAQVIIATGSRPMSIGAFPFDYKKIHSSTSILELQKLPKHLAIVGGGYIGCEFASLYRSLGVKVTLIEALPSIVSFQGKKVSQTLNNAFKKQGITIHTESLVESIDTEKEGVTLHLKGGKKIEADLALVSIGRTLNTDIRLEKAGITKGTRGEIPVNEKMETEVPHIFAIGDVTGKAMLAHVASHQGIVAATNATGGLSRIDYRAIPAVIFTFPEIATVGMTTEEALAKGLKAKTHQFPFQALGKAQAAGEAEGFAEMVIDETTEEILGAQVVGEDASNLIAEMALAINNELTLECITETIHAHPTIAEAWLELAAIAKGEPIHLPPKS